MQSQHISLRDLIAKLRFKDVKCTFLGVGPVSRIVIEAAFEASKSYGCPPIFIASRNQVDLKSLGRGYLMGGMDQQAFVQLLQKVQNEVGYQGPVYICRDHGGPWQRNIELDRKYPIDKAMEIARKSFQADLEAGFNYIHIDPTKCPFPYSLDELCCRTVELVSFCENLRKNLGQDSIDYEVGTEDIQGGLTTTNKFKVFLAQITKELKDKNLPLPTCVVGQTGTLLRIDRNVGHFDKKQAEQLVHIAAKYDIGLKEHNGDYLSAPACRVHPEIGITGMNVAPEFGLVETEACLALVDLEAKLVQEGRLPDKQASHFRELLREKAFKNSPWKKWMTDDIKQKPLAEIESDNALRLLIARVCGHYVYNDTQISQSRRLLYQNIDRFEMVDGSARQFVTCRVRESIEFYLDHFHLKGINSVAHQTK